MPLHLFGSFSEDERELRERQNSAKWFQVCPIQLGGHWRFQDGVAFLMGLQGGFTKLPCYLCLWDSRNTSLHYNKRNWPPRSSYNIEVHNVKQTPLAVPKKVLLPPLHIKLGFIEQFVKKLNSEGDAFKHIQELFPKLSEAKIKGGVLVGLQVRRLMKSDSFSEKLSAVERRAWKSFVSVVKGFLGSHKADNFREIVEELVDTYE